jgi:hypothetical protein
VDSVDLVVPQVTVRIRVSLAGLCPGVKNASGQYRAIDCVLTLEAVTVAVRAARSRTGRGGSAHMADVLYVALLVGMFLLLAVTLRGLERL